MFKELSLKKRIVLLLLTISLIIFLGVLFYVKVGWVTWNQEDLDHEKMGYSFDVATDSAENGLFVAAGNRGLHILKVDQGILTYDATYYDGGYYRNIEIRGERAYVADTKRGLVVLDISGESPITTWAQTDGKAGGLHLDGDLVYVAAFGDGLRLFDISAPDLPVLIGSLETPGEAWDVWVQNGFAYIADTNAGMTVIDVSTPTEPRYIGTTTWVDRYQSAEIIRGEENMVYIAAGSRGFIIIDISDPLQPVVASIYHPTRVAYAEGLAVRNGIVYLAVGSEFLNISTIENGLHIFDVTDPSNPSLLNKVNFPDWVEGVHVVGDYVYIANTYTGVRSIDVQDPMRPHLISTFNNFP